MFDFLVDLCNAFASNDGNTGMGPGMGMDMGMMGGGMGMGGDPMQSMIDAQRAQGDMLSRQMAAGQQQIVQANMQNPRVQQMYQQHRAQGGCLSFPDFAYQYAATGGFTPQGMANYAATERQIQANDMSAWQGYQQAQANRGAAQMNMQQHSHNNQQEFGHTLQGNSTWVDPNSGSSYALPHTAQPGAVYQDPNTGRYFGMDQQGQYHVWENGWWTRMQPRQAG